MDMDIWEQTPSGKKRFRHGKNNYPVAVQAALDCGLFAPDDEDETVCDDAQTCYNCLYHRWTVDSFECMKGEYL